MTKTAAYAQELGTEHGKNAASWQFDGNTETAVFARVLNGLSEGDPLILDELPQPDISELASIRVELDEEAESAYRDAFNDAVHAETERICRRHVPPKDMTCCGQECETYRDDDGLWVECAVCGSAGYKE